MADFQRLLTLSEAAPLPLNAQAAMGAVRQPKRSQFSLLVRHFLERFFNSDVPGADAKTRMVQIGFAAGLPPLVVAVYLWPVYHPIRGWPPGHPSQGGPPPYWLQVNHHLFFVLYSFVAVGLATVFEWDRFFPDLVDLWVLKPLPIAERLTFAARVAAIALFFAGFLFDANLFATLVLPEATDPPNLLRFLTAHALATAGSGLFAAVLVLAFEGALLALLGERLFRKISLPVQSLAVTALLMTMFLFPAFSGAVPALLRAGGGPVFACPPFWFLGVYQCLLEGPAAPGIFGQLSTVAAAALAVVASVAVAAYPLAYMRRVRQLIEGPGTTRSRNSFGAAMRTIAHSAALRRPLQRGAFHFIGQTIWRVPRYRIYLGLYGGVGLSVVLAAVLRFTIVRGTLQMAIAQDGVLAALGVIPFWTLVGLRMAFGSPANAQGGWIFRLIHGRPPSLESALDLLGAARLWALGCVLAITAAAWLSLRAVSPPALLSAPATAAQILLGVCLCILLTDVLFVNFTTVAFTGEPRREEPNLAFTVLKYFTFFPVLIALPPIVEPWLEAGTGHMFTGVALAALTHLALERHYRAAVDGYCQTPALEEDEDAFPVRLGLRL